jgi:prophage regulatory protein
MNTVTRFIDFAEAQRRTGKCRTAIYDGIKVGSFPRPIKDGSKTLFVEAEVEQYLRERIAARDRVAA